MQRRYGLFTAIAMIVGIVIGSGIFFKADNILLATGGNMWHGILLFCLAATGIIFGALSFAELAKGCDKGGGIVAYAEHYYGRGLACAFGWFQTLMYYPALQAVVSWIVGVYACMLLPIPQTLPIQVLVGLSVLIILYIVNICAPKIAGYLQISATAVKILPLLALGIAGIIFGKGDITIAAGDSVQEVSTVGFMAGIAPVAFAFDGWIAATTISKELKREKRDLTLALIIAPICILVLYLIYFVGITKLIGAQEILSMGDRHVYAAAENLLGRVGANAVIVFVLISVIGTCNGLVLGHIRMPRALADNDMIFLAKYLRKTVGANGAIFNSATFSFLLSTPWIIAHYLCERYGLTQNSDVSEVCIVAQYLMYIVLYYQVFNMWRAKKIKSAIKGVVFPLLATFGAVFTFIGGFSNRLFVVNLLIVGAVIIAAFIFERKHKLTYIEPPNDEQMVMFDISPMDNLDIAIDNITETDDQE